MLKLSKTSRVYIAGCGGMLGEAVYGLFSAHTTVKATDIDLNTPWLQFADVRNYREMMESITEFRPDLLLNLAALTDLEHCERNQEDAWLTNALGAENLALIASQLQIPHVYISTAGIFDGRQDLYNDFDAPNPLAIYAKSKYYGECIVQQSLREHFVFRAGWMMGGGEKKDKKFINKIYQQLKAGKRELFVVDDKLGTPTFTESFAQGIFKVVQAGPYGLYNQVCEGNCSRFDVAVEFVRLLGLSEHVRVTKVSSDFFKDDYFAPRPASEKLVNLKLNARKLNVMPHWKDALGEYVKQFAAIDLGNLKGSL
jgi:dTDP-4-dehydrorhamnose reductase